MDKIAHTPTPWVFEVRQLDHGGWKQSEQVVSITASNAFTESDVLVASYTTAFCEYPDDEVNAANAAFIVRACNSHDELVTTLEELIQTQQEIEYCDSFLDSIPFRQNLDAAFEKAKSVLKRTKE